MAVIALCDIGLCTAKWLFSFSIIPDFSDNMAYEKILNKGPTPHYYIKLVV